MGFNEITLSRVLDRWFVDDARYPTPNPQSMLVFTRPPSPPLQERVFHFTKEKVAALKAIVNAEIGTNQNSSLQLLLVGVSHRIKKPSIHF